MLAHGGGTLQVSCRGTAADAMIAMAGSINVMGGFDGYRPLTAEGAVQANPDVVLLTGEGLAALGSIDALWRAPGLALIRAGHTLWAIAMDAAYLLGFGPRPPQAAKALAVQLRGFVP